MQFFKFEGIMKSQNLADENESRYEIYEKSRKFQLKTERFNQKLKDKAYYFVSELAQEMIVIGIICKDFNTQENNVQAFLKAIGVEVSATSELEEVTFGTIDRLLSSADDAGFIKNRYEVLELFALDKIGSESYAGYPRYVENLIDVKDKKTVYKEAETFFANETMKPELDRIYAGGTKTNVLGHPVHYIVETDNVDTRKGLYNLLLEALHANNRLNNRRFMYFDLKNAVRFNSLRCEALYQISVGGAAVIHFIPSDDEEDDMASVDRHVVEAICEAIQKYRNQVLTILCFPRECTKIKEMFYEYLNDMSFISVKEDLISGDQTKKFLRMVAKENNIKADKELLSKPKKEGGYLANELRKMFDEWYNKKLKTEIYPQYSDFASIKKEMQKKAAKGSAYQELSEMIGLTSAKKVIHRAINYYKAQKIFADKGMKIDRPSMHMVFTGNPGTAKTTVARLTAMIMRENGLLSSGHMIECGRGDLVGKYVGSTAPIVKTLFQDAMGGVLFIDEAYSLVDDRDGSFGDEAINTIVQEMENHRDDVVVIFAGYPDKMQGFLKKNPGLQSRIAFHIEFEDYNTEELCEISKLIAKQKGLKLSDDAVEKLKILFDKAITEEDFGNGRYARNIIEKAKMAQAERLVSIDYDEITENDVITIRGEDIELPESPDKPAKSRIGFCA